MWRICRWLLVPPSPTRAPWPWVIGSSLFTAAAMLLGTWHQSLPALPPYTVLSTETSFPEPGIWRITAVGRYHTSCGTVVIHRQFFGDGEAWVQPPINATITDLSPTGQPRRDPVRIDDIRYVLESPEPGDTRVVIFDYQVMHPVREGTYRITAQAFNCDNGLSGEMPAREVQFSWPKEMVR